MITKDTKLDTSPKYLETLSQAAQAFITSLDTEILNAHRGETLEQFWKNCIDGEWLIDIYYKLNKSNTKKLIQVVGYTLNSIKDKITDIHLLDAIDAMLLFHKQELSLEDYKEFVKSIVIITDEISNPTWFEDAPALINYFTKSNIIMNTIKTTNVIDRQSNWLHPIPTKQIKKDLKLF